MEKTPIGSHKNHRSPVRLNGGLGRHRAPIDVGVFTPRGAIEPLCGVVATAARDGENIAQRQGDRGGIPTRIIHVRHPRPGIGLPIENTGTTDNVAPSHHLEFAVRPQHGAATEHVMLVPVDLRHRAGAGIPDCRVGELCTIREGGALVGSIRQDPAIRQIGRGHRNVGKIQRRIPTSRVL